MSKEILPKIIRMKSKDFNQAYPTFFKSTKRNKFGAKKVIIDNKKFDSKSEGDLYAELALQLRQGLIKGLECQAKESFEAYGSEFCNYYCDFKVEHLDGKVEFIEHKSTGTVTDLWRLKWKLLLAKYKNEIEKGTVICRINWYKGYRMVGK